MFPGLSTVPVQSQDTPLIIPFNFTFIDKTYSGVFVNFSGVVEGMEISLLYVTRDFFALIFAKNKKRNFGTCRTCV